VELAAVKSESAAKARAAKQNLLAKLRREIPRSLVRRSPNPSPSGMYRKRSKQQQILPRVIGVD
jgi:hypothetical protein